MFSDVRLFVWLMTLALPVVEASLPANGLCSLFTFVPFSYGNEPFHSFYCGDCNNVGMSHAAAALLAMDHFNARNATVVPELADLGDCPVQFDLNTSQIFDTGTYTHKAAESLLEQLPETPCAVAGPFHDTPVLELSTLAAALKFPLTAHRGFSLRALANSSSPHTSQVYPDLISSSIVLAEYLFHKGRIDYVAFLYGLTETGLYRRETVTIVLDEFGIKNQAFAYNSPLRSPATSEERTIRKALQAVLDSGYRTIVIAPDFPTVEIPLLAEVAVELGLTNGDYMFIWFGDYDPLYGNTDPITREFLAGSIFMTPFEGYHLGYQDPFHRAWRSQGPAEVARLNQANPVKEGEPGYFVAQDDYFTTMWVPEWGSALMYDAVISTGIGACLAMANNQTNDISVNSFVQSIRSASFTGATGVVRFCQDCELLGGRDPYSVVWGFLNNYPPGVDSEDPWRPSELFYFPQVSSEFIFPNGSLLYDVIPPPSNISGESGLFLFINDTIYADGRTVPPDLLRDPPEENYLSRGVQAFGLALFSIVMLISILSAIWVYIHREHRIVKAAQPGFLFLICFGSAVSVSSILTISFDESYGWSEQQLSRACMATPWLACLGHILTYGALFAKLWRVNRVLQFVRRKVDIVHVAWPCAVLVAMALVVLGLWTGLDSLEWNRYEINSITGERIGECSSEDAAAFIAPLVVIVLIPTLLTFYMAWKTKDVDDAFSESRWIFTMVLIQLEVLLFAGPLVPLLRDVSTDARYIGYSLLIWTFPMSTLCLIIGPKVFAVHRKGGERTRGSFPGGVRVSGETLELPPREGMLMEPACSLTKNSQSSKEDTPREPS